MTIEILKRRICPNFHLKRQGGRPVVGFSGNPKGLAKFLEERIRHHSPDGWEWGYQGSGPADLALAILAWVFPVGCDGLQPAKLWRGRCSQIAWTLHQGFKRSLIANLPHEGGDLLGAVIDAWIDGALEELGRQVEAGDRPELEQNKFD